MDEAKARMARDVDRAREEAAEARPHLTHERLGLFFFGFRFHFARRYYDWFLGFLSIHLCVFP